MRRASFQISLGLTLRVMGVLGGLGVAYVLIAASQPAPLERNSASLAQRLAAWPAFSAQFPPRPRPETPLTLGGRTGRLADFAPGPAIVQWLPPGCTACPNRLPTRAGIATILIVSPGAMALQPPPAGTLVLDDGNGAFGAYLGDGPAGAPLLLLGPDGAPLGVVAADADWQARPATDVLARLQTAGSATAAR